ncbi:hypothetical protein [Mesorhizobium sp. 43Arga]
MDPATAAVMILLSCSPSEPFVCKPIDTPGVVFSSLDECRTSLKNKLASAPRGEIVGRCRRIDATVTGSLPGGYSTVIVTRGIGNNGVSSSNIVPHND